MKPRYAVLNKGSRQPATANLTRAFAGIPGMTPADAAIVCDPTSGLLVRGFDATQAFALQKGLATEGFETDVVEESFLPPHLPGRLVRGFECTRELLTYHDQFGRRSNLAWDRIELVAAGSIREAKFIRERHEWTEVHMSHIHIHLGIMIPLPVKETKFEIFAKESSDWALRAEIVLKQPAEKILVEAENFHFACLGQYMTNDLATNFCMLVRLVASHAPQAALNRGATAILAEPCDFAYYRRKQEFQNEIIWMQWRMQPKSEK